MWRAKAEKWGFSKIVDAPESSQAVLDWPVLFWVFLVFFPGRNMWLHLRTSSLPHLFLSVTPILNALVFAPPPPTQAEKSKKKKKWQTFWFRTCVVRKAGVTDPEGSAGLLRAMETRSLPVRKREEVEISRVLGFLLLGGERVASPLRSGAAAAAPRDLALSR